MRSLSDTLRAAAQSPARRPYVKVEVVDRQGVVNRVEWQRLYSGTEPDFHHALALAGDGALLRARVDSATSQLYYMRVPNPGPGSDFSTWQPLASVSPDTGIAISALGSEVTVFYVPPTPYNDNVFYRRSTDYGQTFGLPSTLGAPWPTVVVTWLAATHKPNGDLAVFASAANIVFVCQRTAGSWSSWQPWSNNLSVLDGLAAVHSGDWDVVVCGVAGSGARGVWLCVLGDGYARPAGTWSPLQSLTIASATANIRFRCPSLARPDLFRLFFVEKHSGEEAYARPYWSHLLPGEDFLADRWREPLPHDFSTEYGLALAGTGSTHWLSCPSGVWRGTVSQGQADLSPDLVALTAESLPYSGTVRVELDNSTGKYIGIGSGNLSAVKVGSELRLSLGYHTSAGTEAIVAPICWIEGWEYRREGGRSLFVLEGRDGWGLLEGWRSRRQFDWKAGQKTVVELLAFLLARAGLPLDSLSPSSLAANHRPAFTLHPGATAEEGVRRLLDRVPDRLFFREERAQLKNPDPQEATSYSYGTSHPILSARYSFATPPVNRVQVYGTGVMVEEFSWADLGRAGERLRQVHDINLLESTSARQRAQAELSQGLRASRTEEVGVPVNPAQEPYDVVEVTDPAAGLQAARRRLTGIMVSHMPDQGRYEMRLRLEAV